MYTGNEDEDRGTHLKNQQISKGPMDKDMGWGWGLTVGIGGSGRGREEQRGKNWDNCNRTTIHI